MKWGKKLSILILISMLIGIVVPVYAEHFYAITCPAVVLVRERWRLIDMKYDGIGVKTIGQDGNCSGLFYAWASPYIFNR